MKRSYFCLPREIRQQILFECFALADQEDTDDLVTLGKCFSKEHEVRVKLCQELRPDASVLTAGDLKSRDKKRQEPLWYCPAAEQLLRYLSGVNNAMRRDAKFVVNKWADSKKGPNITLVAKLFEEDVLDSGLMKLACGMSFAASFNALLQNLTEVYLAPKDKFTEVFLGADDATLLNVIATSAVLQALARRARSRRHAASH